ncbi:MAG: mechanosensitive ion channel protein MscL [Candidatus Lumbricidophila eiseniae]|uniref:Large-conductance mechanosensitive channel n=1 Tax=Candidatus Lumbricidiphila eiseniae TaxID=1969409 RepID=A0A2A6FPY0_9MICO|nr:MAG: mechanosensitive ion channel protein MscL [Candidatus Lumbricidophila eiseniae]
MIKGFKDFITRGNVIDLAVAVVIGAAFGAVVTAIVTRVFNPLIGLLFQADSLDSSLVLTIGDAKLQFGAVIGAIISFLLIALVVYLVFIYPMNKIMMLRKKTVADAELNEVELLTQIRDLLSERNGTSR